MENEILNSMSELIASLDSKFNFTYFNRAYHTEFKKIFGPDLSIGDNILDSLAHLPEDQKNAEHIWGRAIKGEEFVVVDSFGDTSRERNIYEISYSSVKDQNGVVDGAMHIVRDVTVRENLKIKADESIRTKERFLSSVSHELRTPLNSILGFSQLLSYDKSGQNVHTYSKSIIRSGKHLLGLINDTLDYNKVQEGMLSISPEIINPFSILLDIFTDMKLLAETSDVTLWLKCEAHKDENILADKQRYKQVILNLVSNAIKYNKNGGSVEIKSRIKNGMFYVDISDTGIGIEKDDISRIWNPFDRLSNENSNIQGTGLGLSITKTLCNMMNGVIDVKSTPGKGSVFSVGFALSKESPRKIDNTEYITKPIEKFAGKVLYIEDNEFNLILMADIMRLNFSNAEYNYSQNSNDGMSMIFNNKPDIILLDINIGGSSGIDVLKNIRRTSELSDKKVIMISADISENIQSKCINEGADAYISKPIIISEFISVMNSVIDKLV